MGNRLPEQTAGEYSIRYEVLSSENNRKCCSYETLESFPNGLPLKNRVNIVLTKNKNYQVKDAVIVHSEEELLEELKKYPSEKIYVIGGESIYKMMLPYCDTVYVTKIDREFQADTYFPNLDQMEDWKMTEEGEEQTCFDLEFAFTKYERC